MFGHLLHPLDYKDWMQKQFGKWNVSFMARPNDIGNAHAWMNGMGQI